MSANKIIFNEGINIGNNGAEHDDEFLFECFIDHPAYATLTDTNDPSTFILGSTGAGKTALLRMIKHQEDIVNELEVHDLSMNYISSNDVVTFLQSLDLDLSVLFQALWKHIFCIEYIKLATSVGDRKQFWTKVEGLFSASRQEKNRKKLEDFVSKNESQFWNTIDENVVELTDTLEKDFTAEFSAEYNKFKGKAGYVHSLGSQQKVQLQNRAKKFINNVTISELPNVITALSDYTRDRQDRYYITVDGLDENWVDAKLKFQLLQALFETLKGLKKLRNFQVVVALRNDLYVKMVDETPASARQIEKYDDLIFRLKWSKAQLKELTEKRVGRLFRKRYSSDNVHFDDIFKQQPNSKDSPWDFIHQRTLRRPRDVINFVNLALQAAEGKAAVSKRDFLTGENNYSDLRRETLIHEWSGTFPAIEVLLELLRSAPAYRQASELCHSKFIDQLYDEIGKDNSYMQDSFWSLIESYVDGKTSLEPIELVQPTLHRLHLIGAVGLKLREDRPWDWIFEAGRPVSAKNISMDTKFRVHPMLFAAMSIRP